jgi:hypothetical protein
VTVLQFLLELFKQPAVSAFIGAAAALLGVPLTQHLTRKATHAHWLREKRASVYADLVTSFDSLAVAMRRMPVNPSPEHEQRYLEATDDYRRAASVTDLYAHREIRDLLRTGLIAYQHAMKEGDPRCYAKGLEAHLKIRPQLIELARNELQSDDQPEARASPKRR